MKHNMFKNWENFSSSENMNTELKLQYAILFRNWKEVLKYDVVNLEKEILYPIEVENEIIWNKIEGVKIIECIKWNYGYIKKFLLKYNSKENYNILNWINIIERLNAESEIAYYSDFIENINEKKSVIDKFFISEQPMLDVNYFLRQELAARQLENNKIQLIFDEVGTGKTVSSLYCVRNILSRKKENAKILILAPNNKKDEWVKDVQRQLGRYAHIVESQDNEEIYLDQLKLLFFKKNEPCIFIEGQKITEKKETLNKWTREDKWDLVIIDEGHICFDNYSNLEAKKAILLTATPIVAKVAEKVNVRTFSDYIKKLCNITNSKDEHYLENLFVNGMNKIDGNENRIFTQLFREDLNINSKKRNIKFLECDRLEERGKYLNLLKNVKGGMTSLIYEQDDDYLLYGIYDKFKEAIKTSEYELDNEDRPNIVNKKYERLKEYLNENNEKSYIIFVNYQYPGNRIYDNLINNQNDLLNLENTIIVKKYGKNICDIFPHDESVSIQNIFDYLITSIEKKKRVIFITTGLSGGTGLNLGRFDGVINYELPFTCIELEQRFGRVDRMNSNAEEKEMIFILNKDSNPMLRYSSVKINETCKYMPIRNTIMFYPEFIKKNIDSLKKELELCMVSEEEKKAFQLVLEERNKVLSEETIESIENLEAYAFKKRRLDNFGDEISKINNYAKVFLKNMSEIISILDKQKKYLDLKNEVENWSNLLEYEDSNIKISEDSYSYQIVEDDEQFYEEYKQEENFIRGENILIKTSSHKMKSMDFWNIKFDNLQEIISKLNMMTIKEQKGTSGVFYIYNKKYIRKTIQEFREMENIDAKGNF